MVNGDDYTTIDSNLGLGTSDPLIVASSLGAAVPEPAGLLVGAIGIAMALGTRRRGK
jgi:hypothetical protein